MPNAFTCGSIRIIARNCERQVVFDENHRAKNAFCYQPYDCCWPKWADAAENFFKETFKYRYDEKKNTLKTQYPEVEKTNETEETLKEYFNTNKIDVLEGIYKSYQTEGMSYYKFAIKKFGEKYKAIILDAEVKIWKPGQVKAYFEPSSINGFYSVKWFGRSKTSFETFGQLESASLLNIEFTDEVTMQKNKINSLKCFHLSTMKLPLHK